MKKTSNVSKICSCFSPLILAYLRVAVFCPMQAKAEPTAAPERVIESDGRRLGRQRRAARLCRLVFADYPARSAEVLVEKGD